MSNETIEQTPKNIVIADFHNGNYSVKTDPVWQYDYGRVMQITGVELPSAYEVHFASDPLGFSKTQIGNENGVRIPDEYLQTGQMVYAWLFLHEGQDDGETRFSISIPVRRRAMPLDVEPTTEEQNTITQTIALLSQLSSDMAQAVNALNSAFLVVNAYVGTLDGRDVLLLDKTITEIRNARFAICKFVVTEWNTDQPPYQGDTLYKYVSEIRLVNQNRREYRLFVADLTLNSGPFWQFMAFEGEGFDYPYMDIT